MSNNIYHDGASIIPNNKPYLKRPNLQKLLETSIQKPVTIIVAGAGYGKTQAVYDFLQEYDAITIWLQLSTYDNIISRLWEKFIYAISLQNEKLASDLTLLGFPETMGAYNRFLLIFSNEVKRDKRYILVNDDFHLIKEKNVLQFYERFIRVLIPNLSIVFISRNKPELDTEVLLSNGLISLINEDNLRFSKSEMIQYFNNQNTYLSSKAITDIYNYTDGWIFAIHLVGLSLKKGLGNENYALSVAKENISKLMEKEIFSVVSKDLQEFLIKLSLVDNLPSVLLMELFPDNEVLIKEMTKISSFIRYDAFLNTYRLHHLFLSFLSEKQNTLKPTEIREIYIKAADWFAKNGYKVDAISFYEKVGNYDEIFKIIITFPSPCSKETANFIIELLERIPENIYDQKPITAILHAKFLLNNFRVEESYGELSKIREKYEALSPTKENKAILGEIYISLGLISFITCMSTRTYEFKQLFMMADEYLPSGSTIVHSQLHLTSGNYVCWVSHSEKGEFERVNEAVITTMPYASRVMNGSGYGYEYLIMAETAFFKRDLKNAEKYACQAIDKSQEKGQYDIKSMAMFYLIRINVAMGHYKKIYSLLEQLRLQAERPNCSDCYTILDIAEGWFYSIIGQTEKVAGWITKIEVKDSNETSPVTFALDRLVRAKCYLSENKYFELLAFLEQHSNKYVMESFLIGLIEIMVLKAVALYHINERKKALTTLQEAYQLAQPNFLVMQFIELGNNMRTLISYAMNDDECDIPKQWLQNIYTKSSTYAKKLACIVADCRILNREKIDIQSNFTKRELDILTDICHGLSREEIAVNRDISINTVKTMLHNIYSKMGAANTLDAVRIATLMDLVE